MNKSATNNPNNKPFLKDFHRKQRAQDEIDGVDPLPRPNFEEIADKLSQEEKLNLGGILVRELGYVNIPAVQAFAGALSRSFSKAMEASVNFNPAAKTEELQKAAKAIREASGKKKTVKASDTKTTAKKAVKKVKEVAEEQVG